MPQYLEFAIPLIKNFKGYRFDSPYDTRRFEGSRRDLISTGFINEPACSFIEEVRQREKDNVCIFGSVLDPYETMWRIMGPVEVLQNMVMNPASVKKAAEKVTDFMIEVGLEQIRRANLPALYIWGDLASNSGMLYSPRSYSELIQPCLMRMCQTFKKKGEKIIYHSDGDIRPALDLLIDAGIDGIDPVQPNALDVVELKKYYGDRLCFVGGMDVSGTKEEINREVLYKLQASRGGGYIVSSGHSIGTDISVEAYDYFVELVRGYGKI